MSCSGAQDTMTPDNRLLRTAPSRRRRTGTLKAATGRFAILRVTASGSSAAGSLTSHFGPTRGRCRPTVAKSLDHPSACVAASLLPVRRLVNARQGELDAPLLARKICCDAI